MITYSSFLWYQSLAEYRYESLQRWNVRTAVYPEFEAEPITLEQAYAHLHIDTYGSPLASDHDDWFEQIGIPGARSWCEAYLGLSIAQQTLVLTSDRFPDTDYIDLPYGPVLGIESVTYLDDGGTEQELADYDYLLDAQSEPHRLYLAYDVEWPTVVRQVRNSVRVRYLTGYSLPDDSPMEFPLPPYIRTGMLQLLGHLFDNRENTTVLKLEEIPIGVRSHLDWDRVRPWFV